jgi:hypothetical protein
MKFLELVMWPGFSGSVCKQLTASPSVASAAVFAFVVASALAELNRGFCCCVDVSARVLLNDGSPCCSWCYAWRLGCAEPMVDSEVLLHQLPA